MINTPTRYDPWVLQQFEGFGGFPTPTAPGSNQLALTGPSASDPSAQVLHNVNPIGSAWDVFSGPNGAQQVQANNCGEGSVEGNGMDTGLMVNGWGNSGSQGTEVGPAVLPQLLQPRTMPSITTASMPTVTGTAYVSTQSPAPVITPQWLNDRLPSIVDTTPMQVSEPCGCMGTLVGDHPVLAVLALLALGYMTWGSLNRS